MALFVVLENADDNSHAMVLLYQIRSYSLDWTIEKSTWPINQVEYHEVNECHQVSGWKWGTIKFIGSQTDAEFQLQTLNSTIVCSGSLTADNAALKQEIEILKARVTENEKKFEEKSAKFDQMEAKFNYIIQLAAAPDENGFQYLGKFKTPVGLLDLEMAVRNKVDVTGFSSLIEKVLPINFVGKIWSDLSKQQHGLLTDIMHEYIEAKCAYEEKYPAPEPQAKTMNNGKVRKRQRKNPPVNSVDREKELYQNFLKKLINDRNLLKGEVAKKITSDASMAVSQVGTSNRNANDKQLIVTEADSSEDDCS